MDVVIQVLVWLWIAAVAALVVGYITIGWICRRYPNEVRAFVQAYERRRGRL